MQDEPFISLFEAAPRRLPCFEGLGGPAVLELRPAPPEPPPGPRLVEPDPEPEEPDLEELLAEAEERGRQRALAELEAEREELGHSKALLEELRSALSEAASAREQELSAQVADLVLFLGRRVVGDSLALHPRALEQVVRAAVGRFPHGSKMEVRVAERDQERVSAWVPELVVVGDPSLGGGCVVRAATGEVDASLEVVSESLEAAVRAWQDEGR